MLKFKLKDQGHTVGIITLPISSLTKRKHEQWIPFQPYKKDRTYHGDLCLNCYVSEVRTSADLSPTNSYNSSSEDVSGGGGGWKALGATFEKWSPLGGKLGGGGGRAASSSDSDIRRDLYGGGHLSPIDDERMGSPLGMYLRYLFFFSLLPPSPSLSPPLFLLLSLSLSFAFFFHLHHSSLPPSLSVYIGPTLPLTLFAMCVYTVSVSCGCEYHYHAITEYTSYFTHTHTLVCTVCMLSLSYHYHFKTHSDNSVSTLYISCSGLVIITDVMYMTVIEFKGTVHVLYL